MRFFFLTVYIYIKRIVYMYFKFLICTLGYLMMKNIVLTVVSLKLRQSLRLIFFYIESFQYSMFYTNCS
jgi:hypothetical protein